MTNSNFLLKICFITDQLDSIFSLATCQIVLTSHYRLQTDYNCQEFGHMGYDFLQKLIDPPTLDE